MFVLWRGVSSCLVDGGENIEVSVFVVKLGGYRVQPQTDTAGRGKTKHALCSVRQDSLLHNSIKWLYFLDGWFSKNIHHWKTKWLNVEAGTGGEQSGHRVPRSHSSSQRGFQISH